MFIDYKASVNKIYRDRELNTFIILPYNQMLCLIIYSVEDKKRLLRYLLRFSLFKFFFTNKSCFSYLKNTRSFCYINILSKSIWLYSRKNILGFKSRQTFITILICKHLIFIVLIISNC